MSNNNLTGHYATNKEDNDIVTVTEIHRNSCDGLDGCVNNNNWICCNKPGEQLHCESHRKTCDSYVSNIVLFLIDAGLLVVVPAKLSW